MQILLIAPYYTGSHASWANGLVQHSQYQIDILSLPGRFWKWRMHGGAVTLAQKFLTSDLTPDLILTTDMLDLTTFVALTRDRIANIPIAIYFHENQLTYPWSPDDRDIAQQRDKHYGFINYTSALAADVVLFNSAYHQESFLAALPNLLKHFPDYNELNTVKQIQEKSRVLSLGLDLQQFDQFRLIEPDEKAEPSSKPLIIWGHRWEYDKGPEEFFKALTILSDRGLDFELAVLGENFSQKPEVFLVAEKALAKHIVQFGYVESFADYARWLWRADILPITSNQDFFGASVVEALYCNCFPLFPKRLAYPHIIPLNIILAVSMTILMIWLIVCLRPSPISRRPASSACARLLLSMIGKNRVKRMTSYFLNWCMFDEALQFNVQIRASDFNGLHICIKM